jgi:alanine dehydrogenase
MAALILTRADVASLLDLHDCIAAVEDAFRQHALGSAVSPAVLSVHADHGAFHIKAAGVHRPVPYFAAKLNGNFSANRERFGLPTIQGVIVLADLNSGTPLAIMDSTEITLQRTGAATAVAATYLSRDEPSTVTIAGCGLQGRVQLRSVAAVRQVVEVHAFDIDARAARAFALEMAPVVGAPIHPTDDLRAALARSDIVVTCTTSRTPIVHQDDIRPGTFVAAVGADNLDKHEIDVALLASADVVVDVLDQAATIGDLHHALAAGVMRREDVRAELGEIVIGRKPARRLSCLDDICVFDSTGMALQDVVAAALVYERARERHVGRSIDLNAARTRVSRLHTLFTNSRHRY